LKDDNLKEGGQDDEESEDNLVDGMIGQLPKGDALLLEVISKGKSFPVTDRGEL
jgi:hypothetical protein